MERPERQDDPEAQQIEPQSEVAPEEIVLELDEIGLRNYLQRLKEEQNLALAIFSAAAAAFIGAVLLAVITVYMETRISWTAIGVGFLVGYTVRLLGKGMDRIFGVVGAFFALLSCAAGNILTIVIMINQEFDIAILEIIFDFITSPLMVIEILVQTFSWIDLLFYGLAIYFGYKLSFRKISEEELKQFMRERPKF